MTELVNMFKNYANFTARTTRKGFWMAVLFLAILSIIVSVVESLLGLSTVYEFAPGANFSVSGPLGIIFALAVIVPGVAIEVRRLRDAGFKWPFIFLGFIPVIGQIALIVMLCKPSVADNGAPVV